MVLQALKTDESLRETLDIALEVENEEAQIVELPMMQLAALSDENICAVRCEMYILHRRRIPYDEDKLLSAARSKDWLKPEGTPLFCLGNLLAYSGLLVTRKYDSSIDDILHDGGNRGIAQQRYRIGVGKIDACGIQLDMTVLNTVIARYQVNATPIDTDHKVGSLIPGLALQSDILCLQIRFIQKGPQYIAFFNALQRRCKGSGACDAEKHHDDQQAGNQFFHSFTPFNFCYFVIMYFETLQKGNKTPSDYPENTVSSLSFRRNTHPAACCS